MVRLRRKLLRDTLLLGATLTLAVVAADQGHGLASLENWAYDRRARAFQFFTPPPTDKLVHLDIDDRTLDVMGPWPWPRSKMADVLDELRLAGPKVVAMDIVFAGAQEAPYEPVDPSLGDKSPTRPIDPDGRLAASLQRSGNVILPVILNLEGSSGIDQAIESAYRADLEMIDSAVLDHLSAAHFSKSEINRAVGNGELFIGRRQAAYALVAQALAHHDESLDLVKHGLLKSLSAHKVSEWNSPTTKLVEEAYSAALAVRAMQRFTTLLQPGEQVLNVNQVQTAPLPLLAEAAGGSAFVNHQFAGEPIVRSSPLLIAEDGRVFMQLGLAMACRMLDADPKTIRAETNQVIVPLPDGQEIDIPVRTVTSIHRVPTVMYIPWFGNESWQTMYDWPTHRDQRQHVPINTIWDTIQTGRHIQDNNRSVDEDVSELLVQVGLDPDVGAKYAAAAAPLDQITPRREMGKRALQILADSPMEKYFADLAKAGPLKPDEKAARNALLNAKSNLQIALQENDKLEDQLRMQRTEMKKLFQGRAVLVGITPSSSTADVVTTSLHDRTPGVIVHGAIFNAIMTRHFWKAAPAYVTVLITLFAGFATAVVTVLISPVPAMLVSALFLSGYVLLNGLLFFDHYGLVVGLAGPCVAIMVVWAGCVMVQTIIEARERALITRRFQTYVDPSLVNYYMENPGKADMKGEMKELTVVFTDLANFTKLAEKLGEKSVELLNRYMALMVPIIRKNSGYLNKFLGDGIMFFYGAPMDNPEHARDAVATTLTMQEAMAKFNAELVAEGLPELGVRAGISTGRMVVGDAGSSDASDYTVLGDAVNLGARLESANKILGTRILMTARTAELAKDKFLFCPVGKLRVVGKTEGVAVFEGVVPEGEPKDIEDRIQLTSGMIQAYQAGEFAVCLAAAEKLAQRYPSSGKLAALYREACQHYLREAAPANFDGSISLTEK